MVLRYWGAESGCAANAADAPGESGETARQKLKYLDARTWVRRAWMDASRLGLHEPPRRRVLDLGTRPGYFPYVCCLLGHDVEALDAPDRKLCALLCEWSGVDVISHRMLTRSRLPDFAHRFDLVTAFRLGFNIKPGRPGGRLFDLEDWSFSSAMSAIACSREAAVSS